MHSGKHNRPFAIEIRLLICSSGRRASGLPVLERSRHPGSALITRHCVNTTVGFLTSISNHFLQLTTSSDNLLAISAANSTKFVITLDDLSTESLATLKAGKRPQDRSVAKISSDFVMKGIKDGAKFDLVVVGAGTLAIQSGRSISLSFHHLFSHRLVCDLLSRSSTISEVKGSDIIRAPVTPS